MPARPAAIHQFTPMLSAGDAVGNQVRYLQRLFRSWGFQSEIYADREDAGSAGQTLPAQDLLQADKQEVVLIHHSFESCRVPLFRKLRARRVVAYHNVTPSRLFEGFEPQLAQACDAARRELFELAPLAERAFAFSQFSADELKACGFTDVSVIPFAIDWTAFDAPPDPARLAELSDGCANVLFVGRLVPNKAVDDVLRVFTAYQRLYSPKSRLVIAGGVSWERPYGQWLQAVRAALGPERVLWMGRASQAELSACFATATSYLSMSRHEGFGVPLLEAMHRGVPVVAYGAAAVPETLGGAGICTLTRDPVEVAKLLAVVERDAALRQKVIDGQGARMQSLYPPRSEEALKQALSRLWNEPTSSRTRAPILRIIAPTADSVTLAVEAAEAAHAHFQDVELLCPRGVDPTLMPTSVRTIPVAADEPGEDAPSTALQSAAAAAPERALEVVLPGATATTSAAFTVSRREELSALLPRLARTLTSPRTRWSVRHAR